MRLSQQVIDTLKTIRINGNQTVMPMLDRKLYVEVNKTLELLGGKWNKSAKAHIWDCDPNDPLAMAVATGEVTDWRKEFQFFETPPEIADRMVDAASSWNDGFVFLEPSAGNGALIDAIKRRGPTDTAALYACELNPKCRATLAERHPDVHLVAEDFMSYNPGGSPECIVMNPPFNHGQDIAHVRHAYDLLRNGGRMAAITSPGWTFRSDSKHTEFRDWIASLPDKEIEDLPAGTFAKSGTGIATKLIVIRK